MGKNIKPILKVSNKDADGDRSVSKRLDTLAGFFIFLLVGGAIVGICLFSTMRHKW